MNGVILSGPLAPVNFSVSPLPSSDCTIEVRWSEPNTSANNTVPSDFNRIQIQYVTDSGPFVEDVAVDAETNASGRVRYVQRNTTFMLRGRGKSTAYGLSPYSEWFGPFYFFFTVRTYPTPMLAAVASAPNTLAISLSLGDHDCYRLGGFRAECVASDEAGSPMGVGVASAGQAAAVVKGLLDHTYYNCTVMISLSATGVNDGQVILSDDSFSASIREYTLPASKLDCGWVWFYILQPFF